MDLEIRINQGEDQIEEFFAHVNKANVQPVGEWQWFVAISVIAATSKDSPSGALLWAMLNFSLIASTDGATVLLVRDQEEEVSMVAVAREISVDTVAVWSRPEDFL